ncbi:MAG: hypothetical protein JW940_08600 [Polyangiaceae bacterium]|nr:hypothetical protein [Polyangiaceae bacterium]
MRAPDSFRRFFGWRWFPFVVPVLLTLLYVLLAVWLVPDSFAPGSGDEPSSDQPDARKGTSAGSRSSSTTRSQRVSSRSAARLGGLRRPADDSSADDQGPGTPDESPGAESAPGEQEEQPEPDESE